MPRSTELSLESLADLCLGQLAEDPQQLAQFMGGSGLSPDALRAALGSDQLARGLIDYFVANESLLLTLCANHGLHPDEFMRFWSKLNPAG